MTAKERFKKVLLPDAKTLFIAMLVCWSLLTLFSVLFFTLKGEKLELFTQIWLAVPSIFIAYFLYGYGRIIVLSWKERRTKEVGLVKQIRKDKDFRSIFTKTGGIVSSFAFAVLYCARGFMIGSGFYWFLAEFYLVAAMLKLYLNTLAETGLVKDDERAYIVVYVVSVFLAVAMAGVTVFVVFFDGIFEKSKFLVGFIAAFTLYKIISASYLFHRARKEKSRLDLSKALVALSSALFSVYTLCVALMIMITENPAMKQFAYLGFSCAIAIFILAVIGLVKSIKEWKKKEKTEEKTENIGKE